jgi:hypothetical protein
MSKRCRKYPNITEKHEIKELQKAAILGTAHTLRKYKIRKNLTWELTLHVAQIVTTE